MVRARTIDELVTAAGQLPMAPRILPRLQRLLEDVNAGLAEIVALVRLDPALAARVVRLSNCAAYGGGGFRCQNVEEALNRLGFADVARLVSQAAAAELMERPLTCYRLDAAAVWARAIATALAAERLAAMAQRDLHTAYSMGLFSQVGRVVVDRFLAARASVVLEGAGFPSDWTRAEQRVVGFSSHAVGARLMRQWGFAHAVAEAVAGQEAPAGVAAEDRPLTALLYGARWLAEIVCGGLPTEPDAAVVGWLGLRESEVLSEVVELRGQWHAARRGLA